jgi:hypothetical protein
MVSTGVVGRHRRLSAVERAEHGERLPGQPLVAVEEWVVGGEAHCEHRYLVEERRIEVSSPKPACGASRADSTSCTRETPARLTASTPVTSDGKGLGQGEVTHSATRSRISLSRSTRARRRP